MLIDYMREEWEREILRCDATVALIKGLPEIANGIRTGDPLAVVAHEYAERLSEWRTQLHDLQTRYRGDPEEWQIKA